MLIKQDRILEVDHSTPLFETSRWPNRAASVLRRHKRMEPGKTKTSHPGARSSEKLVPHSRSSGSGSGQLPCK